MCDVRACAEPAVALVEPGVLLCAEHDRRGRRVVCVHCGVPVVGVLDTTGEHLPPCPRA